MKKHNTAEKERKKTLVNEKILNIVELGSISIKEDVSKTNTFIDFNDYTFHGWTNLLLDNSSHFKNSTKKHHYL